MPNNTKDDELPTWIFVVIAGGLCIPVILVLAILLQPKPPSAAEQAAAQAEVMAAEERAQELQRQRIARQRAIWAARDQATTAALMTGGIVGGICGILTLSLTSYVTNHDVWTGVKVGEKK